MRMFLLTENICQRCQWLVWGGSGGLIFPYAPDLNQVLSFVNNGVYLGSFKKFIKIYKNVDFSGSVG
jgi:hypothetical protein